MPSFLPPPGLKGSNLHFELLEVIEDFGANFGLLPILECLNHTIDLLLDLSSKVQPLTKSAPHSDKTGLDSILDSEVIPENADFHRPPSEFERLQHLSHRAQQGHLPSESIHECIHEFVHESGELVRIQVQTQIELHGRDRLQEHACHQFLNHICDNAGQTEAIVKHGSHLL